jgi:hypothetical protein
MRSRSGHEQMTQEVQKLRQNLLTLSGNADLSYFTARKVFRLNLISPPQLFSLLYARSKQAPRPQRERDGTQREPSLPPSAGDSGASASAAHPEDEAGDIGDFSSNDFFHQMRVASEMLFSLTISGGGIARSCWLIEQRSEIPRKSYKSRERLAMLLYSHQSRSLC